MKNVSSARGAPWFQVRRSPVHGLGAFALRRIRKGTRIIEYLGERVTHGGGPTAATEGRG
ncbi:SET domain protein, partial [mine drainage metagenome]